MTRSVMAFLGGVMLAGIAQAGTIFVNGIAIPGGSGDNFGTSVNNGRLGFFSDIYYDQLATNGGPCPTAAPAAAR